MLPTQSDVHVDQALTNFAQKFLQSSGFIFDKVFSSLPVSRASDKYHKYARDDFWRDQGDANMLLAPGGIVRRGGYRMSTDSYSCDVRAWGKPVSKEVEMNADAVIKSEQDAVDYVMQQLFVRLERQWMTEFFATSIWTTDSTPTNLWSNFTTSDPLADVETGRLSIQSLTGLKPNTFVVGPRVHAKLKHHPLVKEQFKYTSSESVTPEMLARVFEVDRYIVAESVYASNIEGASAAYDFIAGKHALLCYSAPDGSDGATAGRVFKWSGWGNDHGVAVQSYFENQTRSTIVEGFVALDYKVTSADLGYFFNGAVS